MESYYSQLSRAIMLTEDKIDEVMDEIAHTADDVPEYLDLQNQLVELTMKRDELLHDFDVHFGHLKF